MALNFPGPYEVELRYTVSGLIHTQRINCDVVGTPSPGDLPASINLVSRDASNPVLTTAVTAWVTLIKAAFNTATTFDDFTLWKYTPLTFDKTFISTGTLAIAGTDAALHVANIQQILTFRTQEGGPMRVVLMEVTSANELRTSYAASSALYQTFMDFVSGLSSWFLARDTSYAIASLNVVGGQNEALFKIRNR